MQSQPPSNYVATYTHYIHFLFIDWPVTSDYRTMDRFVKRGDRSTSVCGDSAASGFMATTSSASSLRDQPEQPEHL